MRNNHPRSFWLSASDAKLTIFVVKVQGTNNVFIWDLSRYMSCLRLLTSSLQDNVTGLYTPIRATFTFLDERNIFFPAVEMVI